MEINLKKTALNLLIPFSGYYLTKVLPLSPVYFAFIAATLVYFVYTLVTSKFIIEKGIIGTLSFFVYLMVTQPFLTPNPHVFLNIIISLFTFVFGVGLMRNMNNESIIKVAEKFINYSTVLLIVEAFWRITHPVTGAEMVGIASSDENFFIYPYKLSSIMYQDSNFVGIFILCVYFLLFYIKKNSHKKYRLQDTLLIVVTLLTLSRAAIIALILFKVIFAIIDKFKLIYIFILTCIIVVINIGLIIFYFSKDESFISHLTVFTLLGNYLQTANIFHILFGAGFANAVKFFDMGSHNFIVTYIMDTGFIGLFFLFVFWADIAIRTKGKALYIILPFLLAGMSLAGHAIPFFYASLAIIYSIEKNNKTIDYGKDHTI